MKKTLTAASAMTLILSLGACNTVAGIGEDITSASESVQRQISNDNNGTSKRSRDDNELLGGPDGGR